jgi:hypothetical protein
MIFWKRTIPLIIVFVLGIMMFFQYYIPHSASQEVLNRTPIWVSIISAFALAIGLASLVHMHIGKIRKLVPGWGYSAVLLVSMLVMVVVGFISKGSDKETEIYGWMYHRMLVPLQGTMFSILAFFVASAAYKAFRARTVEATLLLVAATIVMIGRVPIGERITEQLPLAADWILNWPAMAARRAIFFGIALAMIATSMRIIFGIERSYLGGGE